eukprot:566301-Pyramimonas_sp.AAC.1
MAGSEQWQAEVTLVHADMRHWEAPELADIMYKSKCIAYSLGPSAPLVGKLPKTSYDGMIKTHQISGQSVSD